MKIKIEQSFLKNSHDIIGLVDKVKKLSTFITRLERQSILFPDRYDPDKYKGDGFELFVEILLKLSPIDNRLGISDYHVETGLDTGVDGYGIGIDGKPATVQVKFRANSQTLLTANKDHLSNFVMSSLMKYNVDKETKTNMLIITTANGLHYFTDHQMFQKQVKCIGYNELRELVDNNIIFWDKFREVIKFNLKK